MPHNNGLISQTQDLESQSPQVQRCWWCGQDPLYQSYHDHEWGFPVTDDTLLFEKICLEGFQAGLSWITILKKRQNFRRAFKNFDIESVSRFNHKSVQRLLNDKSIVRHRGKIEAAINNAKLALQLQQECGSLAQYFWQFEPEPEQRPATINYATVQKLIQTQQSIALSRDLKKRGWRFVGPTTMYAFMQSMGIVNDHIEGCHARERAQQARLELQKPLL